MEASNVTNTLFSQLGYRAERQKVISSNIANINTPNYKTKDLMFEDLLQQNDNKTTLKLQTTDNSHFTTAEYEAKVNPRVVELKGLQEQNDGNNVNLDTQMSEMSKNKMLYDAIQSSIKKDATLFRSVIDSASKN